MLRVDVGAGLGDDLDRPHEAGVGHDVRVRDALQDCVDRRLGEGQVRVDRPLGLWRGAREVQLDLVALYRHADLDGDGLRAEPVVVHVVGELPRAVGQALDLGPRQALRVVDDVRHVALEVLQAMLLDQPENVPLALPQRRYLRLDVAQHLVGYPDVLLDDPPHGLVELPLFVQLQRRQAQAFLVDLGVVTGVAAGDAAADVGLMGDHASPPHQQIVHEDRLEDEDVRQMAGALVRVVVGEDVARLDVVAEVGPDGVEGRLHGAHVEGKREPLRHLVSLRIEDRRGEVHVVPDHQRPGGPHHRHRHGVGGALQVVLDDLPRNRVQSFAFRHAVWLLSPRGRGLCCS